MRPIHAVLNTSAVSAIVGTQIWQDRAPDSTPAPFITWSRMVVPFMGLPHRPVADRMTITVDLMARNEAQRDALLEAVRLAIEPVGVVGTVQSLGQDIDTEIWRYTLDADLYDPR